MKSLKTGDNHRVLEYLYKRIYPRVKAYVCRNSGTAEDAFDIFQDAIVCLCRSAREGTYKEKYEVAGFLYSVSRNLWINKVKRENRSVKWTEGMDIAETYDFSNDIITDQKARTIREVIKRLGEKCFKLLQYTFYQNRSNEEVCELMNFATVNAVKTQKYKCKQKLLNIMEEDAQLKEIFE